MKSQSLKLFAAVFVLGLVTIFVSANSAIAQTTMSFETTFDFHVGKKKLAAGKYQIQRLDQRRYLLRNSESKNSMMFTTQIQNSKTDKPDAEYLTFNRYGEAFFLRQIADRRSTNTANELFESGYEAKVRRTNAENEQKLAQKDKKPSQISVNLNR